MYLHYILILYVCTVLQYTQEHTPFSISTSLCMQLIFPGFSQEVPKCIPVPVGNGLSADGYRVGSHT